MKKLLLSFVLIGSLLSMNSCGEKAKEEKSDEKEKTKESIDEAVEETPEVAEVSCEQPMQDFMSMIKGSYTDVKAALDKFGAEGLARADMDIYDLKEPKVVSCQKTDSGECCTMEAGAGITIRTYDICWTDGKITSVVDKGMR